MVGTTCEVERRVFMEKIAIVVVMFVMVGPLGSAWLNSHILVE